MRTVITVLVSCAIILILFITLIIVQIILCKRNKKGYAFIPFIFVLLPIIAVMCLPLISLRYANNVDELPETTYEQQLEDTMPYVDTSEEYIRYDGENWDFNIKDINFFVKAFNDENLKFLETDTDTLIFITVLLAIMEIISLSGPVFLITLLIAIIHTIRNAHKNYEPQKNVYLHSQNRYSDNNYNYDTDSDRHYDNDRYNI